MALHGEQLEVSGPEGGPIQMPDARQRLEERLAKIGERLSADLAKDEPKDWDAEVT